jgi:hypothetical protein
MTRRPPDDVFSRFKVLVVEVAGTIIFVYFMAKEVIRVVGK